MAVMKSRRHALAAAVVLSVLQLLAAVAAAAVQPYVRAGYGGSQLRMTDFNSATQDGSPFYAIAPHAGAFDDVGPAFGPGASAGGWLSPGIRVGATCSHQHATLAHFLDIPGSIRFDDHLGFTTTEIGAEAAVRYDKLAGLTLGAGVASGFARLDRDFSGIDLANAETLRLNIAARKRKLTWGVFVGLDQRNKAGLAGSRHGWTSAAFTWRPARGSTGGTDLPG